MNKFYRKYYFRTHLFTMMQTKKITYLFLSFSTAVFLAGCTKTQPLVMNTNFANANVANINTAVADTSNWQTYTNEEYGFSFKYPGDYLVTANDANTVTIVSPTATLQGKVSIENSESFSNMSEKEILMTEPGKEVMPLISEKFLMVNKLSSYRSFRQLKKGELLYPPDQYSDKTWTEIEYRYLNKNDLIRMTFMIEGGDYEQVFPVLDSIGKSFEI